MPIRSAITGVRSVSGPGGAALSIASGGGTSFPNATNTGVPAGTTLTPFSGDLFTSADNQTIDALDITGNVVIRHSNVLLKRCRITKSNDYLVYLDPDFTTTGVTVQDCELNGNHSGGTGLLMRSSVQCYRLYIRGVENGVNVSANGGRLQDSYIYDLSSEGSGFHTDGMQFDPDASFTTIEHCNLEPVPSHVRDATSCINLNNETIGTNNHITINNNRIDGRGCGSALYIPRYPGWSTIAVTNNRMLKGDTSYTDGGSSVDWPGGGVTTFTGNVDDITGATLAVTD